MKSRLHSTTRFSNRVKDYAKYRPHYPLKVLEFLTSELGLTKDSVIADIGSGTGISSELFVEKGNHVYGIEPNKQMREAAERLFKCRKNFVSVNATAEDTTLGDRSVDFIVAGQAFHWFDLRKTKTEFRRILRPNGFVILIWNDRRTAASDFLHGYETLLNRYGTDYKEIKHIGIGIVGHLDQFFGKGNYHLKVFKNSQYFDFDGLKGRLLSSSYVPTEGHPDYVPMIDELKRLYAMYEKNGLVVFEYDTKLYYGLLK
ncbi:MAG: methyltransferase domain-containing protein [Bacteroidota bacterium]